MQPSTPSNTCPTCHVPIPADAPGGLCPACTLEKAAKVSHTATGGRRSAPPAIEEIAPHFPELEILELLGAGGMGAVYKARQSQLDRTVALKILSHELSQAPAFVERFNREAKTLARLNHPNIVAVFDFGTAGPYCYLLMEHVDGVNLRQAMRTGGFKPAEALALVQDVCAALQFAHEEGILHRDIKPENILIDSKGRVKIADFGIAKMLGEAAASDVTLTLQGSILGSPHYMAPEQIETPGDIDQRADIYSLGVVLYEMLTGGLPIGRFALPSEKAAMDARIDDIVLRTLAKEREARFQTAREVGTRVDAINQSPAPVSNPSPPAGVESGMVRFSLLSAILTAVSIIFGIIVVYLFATHEDLDHIIRDIGAGWALITLLATLGTAVTGFILGASALGAIRKSGGSKDGLGFAIFAVVTWPIVLMAVLMLSLLMVPLPDGVAVRIGLFLAALFLGIPLLLASFVLIRGLRRWARGMESKDGRRHFPGLTGSVLSALGLTVLGPVLAVVMALMFGPGHDSFEEHPMAMKSELPDTNSSFNEMTWQQGRPEIAFPVRIQAGLRANFILVQRDEKGGTNVTTIGQINADFTQTVMVEVGALENGGSVAGSAPELGATLFSSSQYFKVSTGTDLLGWEFFDAPQEAPIVSEGERREFELANRPETGETLSEVMHLVVETTSLNR
jgi:serine/threonine protein kinase